jgi:hypothetical protein
LILPGKTRNLPLLERPIPGCISRLSVAWAAGP